MAEEFDLSPERIREFRIRKGLSQERLAAMLGVSTSTVIRWEQGSSVPTGTASAVLVAITAGVVGTASVIGLGPLGIAAFGIYRALRDVFNAELSEVNDKPKQSEE
jgi:transcriptional regulator with XRE-family HTH domain